MDYPLLTDSSLQTQITKYEYFIEVVLKGDLQRITNEFEKISERVVEYMNIKSTIKNIQKNDVKTFKSMSDIGSNLYVKCVVPNAETVFLDIGLNCIVQLTLNEAVMFLEQRIQMYNQTLESLIENSSKVKAHIKLILNLIDQLKSVN